MNLKILGFILFTSLLSACTTVQVNGFGDAPVQSDLGSPGQMSSTATIQVLYSEPRKDYESLGTFSVRKYKPGFNDPTVSDAIPDLKTAAARLGCDAVIIRNMRSENDRFITIEGEGIRWK